MRNVRIVGDGVGRGTKVTIAETGEEIPGVTSVTIGPITADDFILASLEVCLLQVDVKAQATFLANHPLTKKLEPVRSITFESGETVEF